MDFEEFERLELSNPVDVEIKLGDQGEIHKGRVDQADSHYTFHIDTLSEAVPKIDLAFAATSDMTKFAFLDNYYVGTEETLLSRGGRVTRFYYRPTTVFTATNNIEADLSQNISGLSSMVAGLDLWLNKSLFTSDSLDSNSGEWHLRYKSHNDTPQFDFKDLKLHFGQVMKGQRFDRFRRKVNLEQIGYISLATPDNSDTNYSVLLEAFRSIERLLSLAFPEPASINEFSVTSQEFAFEMNSERTIWPAYSLITSDVAHREPTVTFPDELRYRYPDIPDFQALLNRWCELEGPLSRVIDFYLSVTSGNIAVIENVFLTHMQALEGFWRSFRPDTRMPQDQYDQRVKDLVALPCVNAKQRKLIKGGLRLGNELSLAERIENARSELANKGIRLLADYDSGKLADTRNKLTHTLEDDRDVYTPVDMASINAQLSRMILSLVLLELGLPRHVVARGIGTIHI